jgi:RNA polymerase sigma-70 factor, ECF subfamily
VTEPAKTGEDVAMALAAHRLETETPVDAASFRSIYEEHSGFVWRVLIHLGIADAQLDDALQEVFIVVHRRLDSYDPALSMRAWLRGIARNVAHHIKRAAAREHRRRDALASETAHIAPFELAPELRWVRDILMQMDEPMREVLVLADVEGLTAPEIADTLEINVNTAYSRLRIARQRFAEAVRRRGGGDGR